MRFEYWITKAANTRSEYVIIIAFPRHRWVHEHAFKCYIIRMWLVLFRIGFVVVENRTIKAGENCIISAFSRKARLNCVT